MRVRWTTDAADDLERICDYTAESRPESARRVAQSVVERIGTLEALPHLRPPSVRDGQWPTPTDRAKGTGRPHEVAGVYRRDFIERTMADSTAHRPGRHAGRLGNRTLREAGVE
jgi:plasmid stabilization system protein ParE